MKSYNVFKLSTVAAAILLVSCSSGGTDTATGTTTFSLSLSDAPVDGASQVVVNIQGVHLHSPKGADIIYQYCDDGVATDETELSVETDLETTTNSENTPAKENVFNGDVEATENPDVDEDLTMQDKLISQCDEPVSRPLNLLALTDGKSVNLLDDVAIEPGRYPWIRLTIDEANPGYIVLLDGTEHPLSIPSGAQSGLKINQGFTAFINGDNRFMIDFDLRKSVNHSAKGYKLRPTLRLIQLVDDKAQRLTGMWAVSDMPLECASPMAYVYGGHEGVSPDDMGGANSNPVTTVPFVANNDGATFGYQVDYLSPGEYTVAYTCQGDLDTAGSDEDIKFESTHTVTVGSGDATGA